MITLKTLASDSVSSLSELCTNTFIQAYQDVHSEENLRRYCEQNYSVPSLRSALSSDRSYAVMAFANTAPAGYYLISHEGCPVPLEGSSCELKQIYVLSEYYGLGLGATLFEHATSHVRDRGCDWLWLCVSDINHRAIAFYQKLGFSKSGTGPVLEVGSDRLKSSLMSLWLGRLSQQAGACL